MSDQELIKYRDSMNDCWLLFKKYATSGDPDTDTYWIAVMKDAEQVYQRHKMELTKKVVAQFVAELERIGHEKSAR